MFVFVVFLVLDLVIVEDGVNSVMVGTYCDGGVGTIEECRFKRIFYGVLGVFCGGCVVEIVLFYVVVFLVFDFIFV